METTQWYHDDTLSDSGKKAVMSAPNTPRPNRSSSKSHAAASTRQPYTTVSSPFAPRHNDSGTPAHGISDSDSDSDTDSDASARSARRSLPDISTRQFSRQMSPNEQRSYGLNDILSATTKKQMEELPADRTKRFAANRDAQEMKARASLSMVDSGRALSLIKEGDSSFESAGGSNRSPTAAANVAVKDVDSAQSLLRSRSNPGHNSHHRPGGDLWAGSQPGSAVASGVAGTSGSRGPQLEYISLRGQYGVAEDTNARSPPRQSPQQQVQQVPASGANVEKLRLDIADSQLAGNPVRPKQSIQHGNAVFDGSSWSDGWPYEKFKNVPSSKDEPLPPQNSSVGSKSRIPSFMSRLKSLAKPAEAPGVFQRKESSQQQERPGTGFARDQTSKDASQPNRSQIPKVLCVDQQQQQQVEPQPVFKQPARAYEQANRPKIPQALPASQQHASVPRSPQQLWAHGAAKGTTDDNCQQEGRHSFRSDPSTSSAGGSRELLTRMSMPDSQVGPRRQLGTFGAGLVPFPASPNRIPVESQWQDAAPHRSPQGASGRMQAHHDSPSGSRDGRADPSDQLQSQYDSSIGNTPRGQNNFREPAQRQGSSTGNNESLPAHHRAFDGHLVRQPYRDDSVRNSYDSQGIQAGSRRQVGNGQGSQNLESQLPLPGDAFGGSPMESRSESIPGPLQMQGHPPGHSQATADATPTYGPVPPALQHCSVGAPDEPSPTHSPQGMTSPFQALAERQFTTDSLPKFRVSATKSDASWVNGMSTTSDIFQEDSCNDIDYMRGMSGKSGTQRNPSTQRPVSMPQHSTNPRQQQQQQQQEVYQQQEYRQQQQQRQQLQQERQESVEHIKQPAPQHAANGQQQQQQQQQQWQYSQMQQEGQQQPQFASQQHQQWRQPPSQQAQGPFEGVSGHRQSNVHPTHRFNPNPDHQSSNQSGRPFGEGETMREAMHNPRDVLGAPGTAQSAFPSYPFHTMMSHQSSSGPGFSKFGALGQDTGSSFGGTGNTTRFSRPEFGRSNWAGNSRNKGEFHRQGFGRGGAHFSNDHVGQDFQHSRQEPRDGQPYGEGLFHERKRSGMGGNTNGSPHDHSAMPPSYNAEARQTSADGIPTPSTPSPRMPEVYTVQSPIPRRDPGRGPEDGSCFDGAPGHAMEYRTTTVACSPQGQVPVYETTVVERGLTPNDSGGTNCYERKVTTTSSKLITTETVNTIDN